MELLVAGASVGLLAALLPNGKEPELEEHPTNMLESPRELFLHEFRERGALAPAEGPFRGRMPWDENLPPYYIAEQVPHGPNSDPTERIYHAVVNAYDHRRQEVAEEFNNHRDTVARRRGQPIWTAFSDELHLDGRSTDHVGFRWMPKDPTDSDWNEAGLLARAVPPDSTLYTPEANYLMAPGLTWRYGQGQTH